MKLRRVFFILALFSIAGLDQLLRQTDALVGPPRALIPAPSQTSPLAATCDNNQLLREGLIPMPKGVPSAHASQLLALPAKHPLSAQQQLVVFWFAGSREGAADVRIAASTFDRQSQTWSPARWVVSAEQIARELGLQIRRLGNPVAWVDARGRIQLFVVTTGLGGWAASRVIHLEEVAPLEFKARRVLPLMPLNPLFNTSVLVRNAPLPLEDGGIVLPVYFELGLKYGLALRLNADGQLVSLTRITQRRRLLQPALIALDAKHWQAFMRSQSDAQKIALSESRDGGRSWQDLGDLPLGNPDASVSALRLQNGLVALVHNPSEKGREVLQLSLRGDDQWQTSTLIEGESKEEFSYPSMIETTPEGHNNPELWISYTHLRQAIGFKHIQLICQRKSP